jgi:hypothetical protein
MDHTSNAKVPTIPSNMDILQVPMSVERKDNIKPLGLFLEDQAGRTSTSHVLAGFFRQIYRTDTSAYTK